MTKKKQIPDGAKLVVTVESPRGSDRLRTRSVYDCRTGTFWDTDRIRSHGVADFLSLEDLKETLNWCLDGDEVRYRFTWEMSTTDGSVGKAYVYYSTGKDGQS